jgi:hypothetical protein
LEAILQTDSAKSPFISSINFNAFLRALAMPLITWLVVLGVALLGGQPGVICVTPMAWLLSLVCGGQYIRLVDGRQGRWPLLGPALAGATLGLCMSILFIIVNVMDMPIGPGELFKDLILNAFILVAGILICAGLSVFTGWLTLNQILRGQR